MESSQLEEDFLLLSSGRRSLIEEQRYQGSPGRRDGDIKQWQQWKNSVFNEYGLDDKTLKAMKTKKDKEDSS